MKIVPSIVNWYFKQRYKNIEQHYLDPLMLQQKTLHSLMKKGKNTTYGEKYNFSAVKTYEQFLNYCPSNTYQTLHPYINKIIAGEKNVLWPSKINWFAKSSGTTSGKSKFIPVSYEALEDCHFKGGRDVMSFYCNQQQQTPIFEGKGLTVGGSNSISTLNNKMNIGDVSAVMIENMPFIGQLFNTPDKEIALLDNWELKIEKMAAATSQENVTMLIGVPSWTLVLLNKILQLNKTEHITDVWPNLELFIHGGVSFVPYKNQFNPLFGNSKINYLETYNASEGFFAIQDNPAENDMLLMLDYGIFYEFYDEENDKYVWLDNVKLHKKYTMVISTNAGLWRYKIGDTVSFTNLNPFKIKILGREVQYINIVGEELIVANSDAAVAKACEKTNATLKEYSVAPIFMKNKKSGGHEWVIEFEQEPKDFDKFCHYLDEELKNANTDYAAKRFNNMVLNKPKIHKAPKNLFYNWLKKSGKLGGQHKVPRLSNNRKHLEAILQIMNTL